MNSEHVDELQASSSRPLLLRSEARNRCLRPPPDQQSDDEEDDAVEHGAADQRDDPADDEDRRDDPQIGLYPR
jgi:hypothetical protein